MVATSAPFPSAPRPFGVADPACFAAAMGVSETLVHSCDVALGLGTAWAPPAQLCSRALRRLFPEAPVETDPWPTLLWATGRGELAGHPPVVSWHWHTGPRDD
jgi:hypothetical protein